MGAASNLVTAVHILVTLGIILVPIFAAHQVNPYQRRAEQAIRRLKARDDSMGEMYDVTDEEIEEALAPHIDVSFEEERVQLKSDEENLLMEKLSEDYFEKADLGFIQRGDPGFKILLDAIAQNRTIRKDEVTSIGLMSGPIEIFKGWDLVDEISVDAGVSISPNAALFVDYDEGPLAERQIIHFYPESPSPTLHLEELQMWTKEAIRRKAHHATVALALVWVLTSVLTLR